MKYDFEQVKKELLEVKNGDEWNLYRVKYPDVLLTEIDLEMKKHINWLIRQGATKEQLENPHIHYEVARKKKKPE